MKNPGGEYQYGAKKKSKQGARQARTIQSVMPCILMAVLAMAGAAMLIMSLFIRVEITEVNDQNVELRQELEQLTEENRRMRIEYEFAQDLDEIEKDAKGRLGMQSSLQRQAEAIDTCPEDKAYVIDNG